MHNFSLSHKNLKLHEVHKYYFYSEKALIFYFKPENIKLHEQNDYIGFTNAELRKIQEKMLNELELSCCFSIIAALEASFQIDYQLRCMNKKKDFLSKNFLEIYNSKAKNVRTNLEQDILNIWYEFFKQSSNTQNKNIISEFKAILNFRHWVAHGRYWNPKLGREKYNYIYIYQIAEAIYTHFEFKVY